MHKLVEEAANENATYRLFKARKNIKQAQEIIKPTLEDARNTKAVFTELLESNKENQIQYDALIKVYRELRKDILANSFEYGAAIDQVEDQLASMESDFEEAKIFLHKVIMLKLSEFCPRFGCLWVTYKNA